MFEYDQKLVDELLAKDAAFRKLHEEHHRLKVKVHDAEVGDLALDDFTLTQMKKEKLLLKDKMAAIIAAYHAEQG